MKMPVWIDRARPLPAFSAPVLLAIAVALAGTIAWKPAQASDGCSLQSVIEGVDSVHTYDDSAGSAPSLSIPATQLTFPLQVFERANNGLYKVLVAGRSVWVDSSEFRSGNCVSARNSDAQVPMRTDSKILGSRNAQERKK